MLHVRYANFFTLDSWGENEFDHFIRALVSELEKKEKCGEKKPEKNLKGFG